MTLLILRYISPSQDASQAATVTVIRKKNFFGAGLVTKVTLDGYVVAKLGPGHYVNFPVDAGMHSIGITESASTLILRTKKHYYFLVSNAPGGYRFESERIHAAQAQSYISSSTRVQ